MAYKVETDRATGIAKVKYAAKRKDERGFFSSKNAAQHFALDEMGAEYKRVNNKREALCNAMTKITSKIKAGK